MYGLRNVLDKQPIQIATAVMAIVNLCVIAGWVHLASTTVAGGNTTLVLVLGLFVKAKTATTAALRELTSPPQVTAKK